MENNPVTNMYLIRYTGFLGWKMEQSEKSGQNRKIKEMEFDQRYVE